MKKFRVIIIAISITLLILISFGCYFIYQDNRTVAPPSQEELSASLEKSIQWLISNRSQILKDENCMLWWMVKESAELTNDYRLLELFDAFKTKLFSSYPNSPWLHLFDSECTAQVGIETIAGYLDYQVFLLYGITCSEELEGMDIILRQKQEDFCLKNHPISPACVTHQLIGIRLMERRNCGDPEDIQRLIGILQDKIVTQLTLDFRVVDVYIQRLLTLVESGARERIKPVWLKNVLDAQLSDGGWGDNHPLIPFGSSRYLSFTGRGIGIRRLESNFHATAQGVFLMSLLQGDIGSAGEQPPTDF